jgi:uncharacterized membrane protein YesL
MKAFVIMGRTFKSTYEDLFLIVALSVAWWAGTLLVVTAPMTTTGLYNVANRIANYKRVNMSFFWEGARSNVGKGVLLFLLVVLMPPLIIFSMGFYLANGDWQLLLAVVMGWVMLLWLMAGQFFFPLFWQQEKPSLSLILRNSFVLAVRHPLYAVLMLIFQLVLIILSVVLVVPIVLILPGMIALAQNHALTGLLQDMGLAPEPPVKSGT